MIAQTFKTIVLLAIISTSTTASSATFLGTLKNRCSLLISGLSDIKFKLDNYQQHLTKFWETKQDKKVFPLEYFEAIKNNHDQLHALMAWNDYVVGNYELSFLAQLDALGPKKIVFKFKGSNIPSIKDRRSGKIIIRLENWAIKDAKDFISRTLWLSRALADFKLQTEAQKGLFFPYLARSKKYKERILQTAAQADLSLFSKAHHLENIDFGIRPSEQKRHIREFFGVQQQLNPTDVEMQTFDYVKAVFGIRYIFLKYQYRFSREKYEKAKELFLSAAENPLYQYQSKISSPELTPHLNRTIKTKRLSPLLYVVFGSSLLTASWYTDAYRDFLPSTQTSEQVDAIQLIDSEGILGQFKEDLKLLPDASQDKARLIEFIIKYDEELKKNPPNTIILGLLEEEIRIILNQYKKSN